MWVFLHYGRIQVILTFIFLLIYRVSLILIDFLRVGSSFGFRYAQLPNVHDEWWAVIKCKYIPPPQKKKETRITPGRRYSHIVHLFLLHRDI